MTIDWEPIEPVPREAQEMARVVGYLQGKLREQQDRAQAFDQEAQTWRDMYDATLTERDEAVSALRESKARAERIQDDAEATIRFIEATYEARVARLTTQLRDADERDKEYTRQLYAWKAAYDRLREALERAYRLLSNAEPIDQGKWGRQAMDVLRAALHPSEESNAPIPGDPTLPNRAHPSEEKGEERG